MYRDIAVMACSLAGELGHDTMEKLYRDTIVMGVQLGCWVSVSRYTRLYRDRSGGLTGWDECVVIHSVV